MRFDDLVNKVTYLNILEERYYKYSVPSDKKKLMYDFYVLSYLSYLLTLPSKSIRDLNPEIEDTIKDAVSILYPALREELLNAVFYSVCAEMRHSVDTYAVKTNTEVVANNPKFAKIWKAYRRYMTYHTKDEDDRKTLTDIFDVKTPSSEVRPPESEQHQLARNRSFKAANYAIKEAGASRSDFIQMASQIFKEGQWDHLYGGQAWGRITDGWMRLAAADKISAFPKDSGVKQKGPTSEDMGVAIDHVYDLQHNTDTVFNKLKSYYDTSNGYDWIKEALDHKANAKSYYELLPHASILIKQVAKPVLYNKMGQTWEKETNYQRPNQTLFKSTDATAEQTPNKYKVGDILTDEDGNREWEIVEINPNGTVKLKITKGGNTVGKLHGDYDVDDLITNSNIKYVPKKLPKIDLNIMDDEPNNSVELKPGMFLYLKHIEDLWKILEVDYPNDNIKYVDAISGYKGQLDIKIIENNIKSGDINLLDAKRAINLIQALISSKNKNNAKTQPSLGFPVEVKDFTKPESKYPFKVGDLLTIVNNNTILSNHVFKIVDMDPTNGNMNLINTTTGSKAKTTINNVLDGIYNKTMTIDSA